MVFIFRINNVIFFQMLNTLFLFLIKMWLIKREVFGFCLNLSSSENTKIKNSNVFEQFLNAVEWLPNYSKCIIKCMFLIW